MKKVAAVLLALGVGLLSAIPAKAVVINWALQDARFEDGTNLTGTFTIDTTTPMGVWPIAHDIQVEAGWLTAYNYNNSTSHINSINLIGTAPYSFMLLSNDFSRYINMQFTSALTSPGIVALYLAQAYECPNCASPLIRDIISGSVIGTYAVTATPIPGAFALFASVLGMFGFGRWIKRKFTRDDMIPA